MSIVLNTKPYEADIAISPNQVPFKGPANTLSVKDRLDLFRVEPKAIATFSGVGRSRAKFVRTLVLTDAKTTTGDAIADINISIPVGASEANIDSLADDIGAFTSSATFKLLLKKLDITH